MDYKLNPVNWSEFDFLVNNFYEIVEYKRGRGVYGDRVILKRPKNASSIFGDADNSLEFYYLDAQAVHDYTRTKQEKIQLALKYVTSPESMSAICKLSPINVIDWSITTRGLIYAARSLDYNILNDILVRQYTLLDKEFLNKLNKHRTQQYYIASSDSMSLVSKEYAKAQLGNIKSESI